MITYEHRKDKIKENIIEYIKKHLDIHHEFILKDSITAPLYNCDELQVCEILSVERISGDYIAKTKGQKTEEEDDIHLDELSTDTLSVIADKILFNNIPLDEL